MAVAAPAIDPAKVRLDFPLLQSEASGRTIAYLDNGATSQKPQAVLDALDRYWREQNANVHRGVHYLSQVATERYEAARSSVRDLLNAPSPEQVILTHGCTESINAVAFGLSTPNGFNSTNQSSSTRLTQGDQILISNLEHHSNIVPWQMAAQRVGADVRTIPITDSGEIDLEAYRLLLSSGPVKVVAINHVSNALGTVNPVKQMIAWAHQAGALVMVDGAQGGPHLRIDVQDLDADFYALSCHKMYAPTGVGVLYGKRALLEELPPYQGGGDMIRTVAIEQGTTYAALPSRHEAGTPNIAGGIGLGAAVEYLRSIAGTFEATFEWVRAWEHELTRYATDALSEIEGLTIHGTAPEKAGIISFTLDCAHPHDVGTVLDGEGVAVRTGHHCCMPLMNRLGVPATTRASLAFYNSREDIDRLVRAVRKVRDVFAS
jgi:cysteine desulfurase/selenocysteine lyase